MEVDSTYGCSVATERYRLWRIFSSVRAVYRYGQRIRFHPLRYFLLPPKDSPGFTFRFLTFIVASIYFISDVVQEVDDTFGLTYAVSITLNSFLLGGILESDDGDILGN